MPNTTSLFLPGPAYVLPTGGGGVLKGRKNLHCELKVTMYLWAWLDKATGTILRFTFLSSNTPSVAMHGDWGVCVLDNYTYVKYWNENGDFNSSGQSDAMGELEQQMLDTLIRMGWMENLHFRELVFRETKPLWQKTVFSDEWDEHGNLIEHPWRNPWRPILNMNNEALSY